MSKLKCNISEDLMPLYIEDILSEESKKDMELHLEECENCKKIYNELKEDVNLEYEKNSGIAWVWEHRLDDLDILLKKD